MRGAITPDVGWINDFQVKEQLVPLTRICWNSLWRNTNTYPELRAWPTWAVLEAFLGHPDKFISSLWMTMNDKETFILRSQKTAYD